MGESRDRKTGGDGGCHRRGAAADENFGPGNPGQIQRSGRDRTNTAAYGERCHAKRIAVTMLVSRRGKPSETLLRQNFAVTPIVLATNDGGVERTAIERIQ